MRGCVVLSNVVLLCVLIIWVLECVLIICDSNEGTKGWRREGCVVLCCIVIGMLIGRNVRCVVWCGVFWVVDAPW